ncbi:putative short-chain dehydrogenase reductase family [Phaeomoniella chlamydospora]|uniref:Putative short-chain dehydrogenase reductase family n=1 Tax=Phaeomoniella chlamydospora TaxID=158046 RepID=A0A0G2GIQ9_PHACM|nr:putative short-chain dehydrogenase reductase family [Phaeomoniella chlamydospora]
MDIKKVLASSKYNPPKHPAHSFTGKTVLITGSNTGLGLAAAKKIASLGAKRIILGVRNLEKGERAKTEVAECAKDELLIQVKHVDMERFSSVREFAQTVCSDLGAESLDVVLLNAGVTFLKPHTSSEGWRSEIQVNALSTILLAILLLPKLKESVKDGNIPILTFTSSGTHKYVPTSFFEDLPRKTEADTPLLSYWSQPDFWPGHQQMYGLSKLLLELGIHILTEKVIIRSPTTQDLDIVINSCCPGICRSEFSRDFTQQSTLYSVIYQLISKLLLRTAEEGSRTLVSATTLGPESHGRFWQNDQIVLEDRGVMSGPQREELARKVWAEMMTIFRTAAPEVEDILGKDVMYL